MSPFAVLIKTKDGDLHWREEFQTLGDLNKWLAQERTRKYWDAEWITEVVDNTTALENLKNRIAQEQAAKEQIKIAALALRDKPIKSAKDVEELLNLVVDFYFK